MEQLYPTCNK